MKDKIMQILQLHKGRSHPITSIELGRMIGADDRAVRGLIGQLIRDGHLICAISSDPMGYFLPANLAEVLAYERTLKARALKILTRLKFISKERTQTFLQEQLHFFIDEDTVQQKYREDG